MPNNQFGASILARLDTSQIPGDIEKISKSQVTLKNLHFDPASLAKEIQAALDQYSFNLKFDMNGNNSQAKGVGETFGRTLVDSINTSITESALQPAGKALDELRKNLSGKNISSSAIDKIIAGISDSARQANIQITKISDTLRSTNGKQIMTRFSIEGIDDLGNFVRIVDTFDSKTGAFKDSVSTVDSVVAATASSVSSNAARMREKLENLVNVNIGNGKFKAEVDSINASVSQLTVSTDSIQGSLAELNSAFEVMSNPNASMDDKVEALKTYQNLLPGVRAQLTTLTQEENRNAQAARERAQQQAQAAKAEADALREANKEMSTLTKSNTLSNNIQTWMNTNTRAAEQFGDELRQLQAQLKGNIDSSKLQQISQRFNEIKSEARAAGLTTDTFGKSLGKAGLQLLGLSSGYMVLRKVVNIIKTGINTVIELDDALVDLKKTCKGTAEEIEQFYYDANEQAKELGVTTREVIQSASDWSRLGYSLSDAKTMSRVSSIFTAISPDLDIEQATDGLVSAMKANIMPLRTEMCA